MKRRIALAAVLAACAPHAAARAENPGDVEEVVVTGTVIETPLAQVPQSVTIVTSEDLERKGETQVVDALRDVPGLDIAKSGAFGGNTSVFLRGGNSEHTLVMIDGVAVNDPSSPNRAFDFANLPVSNIERIEVLRGAESVLYGSDAMAGVINIITKRGSGAPSVSASAEGGSYGTFTEQIQATRSSDRGDVSLGAFRQDSRGFSAADEKFGNSEDDAYENSSASLRAGFKASDTVRFDMTGLYQRSHSDLDNFGGIGGDDPNRRMMNEMGMLRGEGTMLLFDRQLEEHLGVSYLDNDRTDNNDPDELNSEYLRSRYRGSRTGLDWRSIWSVSDLQKLLFGVDWYAEHASSRYFSESEYWTVDSAMSGKNARNTAYYLQDQFAYEDTWFASAGLRADDHSDFGTHVTWRVAPAVKIHSTGTRLHSSVGTGFKAPSVVQLYSEYGNPDLQPEKSLSVDAGVDQNLIRDTLDAGVTFFWNRFDNLITFNSETLVLENINKADTWGLEFSERAYLTKQVTLGHTLTLMRTEDKSTGEELLRRAKVKTAFNVDWAISDALNAFFEVVFVGDRRDNDYNAFPAERVTLPRYTLLNMKISYEISPGVEIYARGENLLDQNYEQVYGYSTAGSSGYGGINVKL